jgi:hypothetical protein
MSQAELLPAAPVSLPPLTYKGQPVITTEMLAAAYDCETASIRKNFSNHKERFTEGKHFYSLQNGELQTFRDCVKNIHAVVPARTRNLTLWLERGAARHAKMLNTDRAWDVFEMLEETFFRVVKPETKPSLPETTTPSTPADRKPLRSLVNAWAKLANVHQSVLWPQVRAHFQLERIDDLPVEWIPQGLAFVQGRIDEFGKEQKALPGADAFIPVDRQYERLYADMQMVEKITRWWSSGAMIDLCRSGPWSHRVLVQELMRHTRVVSENVAEASRRMLDCNRLAKMLVEAQRTADVKNDCVPIVSTAH